MEYFREGNTVKIILIFDNDEWDEINSEPPLIIPDHIDMDKEREFSLELGSDILYEIYKQKYRPIKEIRLVRG